jgi:hypothetical protein
MCGVCWYLWLQHDAGLAAYLGSLEQKRQEKEAQRRRAGQQREVGNSWSSCVLAAWIMCGVCWCQ